MDRIKITIEPDYHLGLYRVWWWFTSGSRVMRASSKWYTYRPWAVKLAQKIAAACAGPVTILDEHGKTIPYAVVVKGNER